MNSKQRRYEWRSVRRCLLLGLYSVCDKIQEWEQGSVTKDQMIQELKLLALDGRKLLGSKRPL